MTTELKDILTHRVSALEATVTGISKDVSHNDRRMENLEDDVNGADGLDIRTRDLEIKSENHRLVAKGVTFLAGTIISSVMLILFSILYKVGGQ